MTSEELGWDAPLNADGETRRAAIQEALSVPMPHLQRLLDELRAGVSCEDWGFPQLVDIHDVEQRALVSDQLLGAADGIQDAIVDAGISAFDVDLETGPNGISYRGRDDTINDMLHAERLRRAVAAFFDAVGTALDCLSAVLIVVTRAPLSVQRADYTQLIGLDPTKAYANAFAATVPQTQRDLWTTLLAELRSAAGSGPRDWLSWSLEMRNALTHRGRITDVYLPRAISGRLLVPPTSAPQSYYRYDLHLRSRPWLPGLEQLLAGPGLPGSWLDEPAGRTIAGLRDELLAFCERLAAWSLQRWTSGSQSQLVAPVRRWVLAPAPQNAFVGVNPGGTTPIRGAIGGVNQEHLRLAERVRRRRAGLPDLGAASGQFP